MTIEYFILMGLAVVGCRFEAARSSFLSKGLGLVSNLALLLFPLIALYFLNWPAGLLVWEYTILFALTAVAMVFLKNWEKQWTLILFWLLLPICSGPGSLTFLMALFVFEFLFYFALVDGQDAPRGFMAMSVFRFILLIQLCFWNQLEDVGIIALAICHTGALALLVREKMRRKMVSWPFLISFAQYGLIVWMRVFNLT